MKVYAINGSPRRNRNTAKTLHEELKEKGIFVGLVTVCDVIAPDTKHSPELIAEKFLELYKQQDKYEIAY